MKIFEAPHENYIRIFGTHAIQFSTDHVIVPKGIPLKAMTRPKRSGWIKAERFCGDLIVDGISFGIFLKKVEHPPHGELLNGYGMHLSTPFVPLLHPNLGMVLKQRPDFIPKKFLKDEQGNPRRIYFSEIQFKSERGRILCYCLRASGSEWVEELRPVHVELAPDEWVPIGTN